MKLTVEELRTLQLALINMESGLTESGIAKVKSLSDKLESEVQRLTKRTLDLPSAVVCECGSLYGVHEEFCPKHKSANQ